jgi:hypothetical protein
MHFWFYFLDEGPGRRFYMMKLFLARLCAAGFCDCCLFHGIRLHLVLAGVVKVVIAFSIL